MKLILKIAITGLMVAYLGLCAALYIFQRNFLYFPTPEVHLNSAEAIYQGNANARIKIWKVASGNKRAIIYFGGNAEEVSRNIEPFKNYLAGYDVYLMNYRGFSGSGGTPNESEIYQDSLSLYDFIASEYDGISVIGRSLGSGVATYLAANRKVEKVSLFTPYDSVVNVAKVKLPFVPVSILLHDHYDSVGRAHKITSPTLIITAQNDQVILKRSTDALVVALSNADVKQVEIPATNHLTVSTASYFWEMLRDFFAE